MENCNAIHKNKINRKCNKVQKRGEFKSAIFDYNC